MAESILPAVSKEPVKSPKRGFGFKAALSIGGLLAVVTILVLWAVFSKGSKVDNKSAEAGSETVPVAKASRADLTRDISLYAEFRPYQEVLVHAKVSGYVQSIRVDIGDHVQAGEPLATLEVPELNDDVNRATAALAKSREDVPSFKIFVGDFRDREVCRAL